MKAAAYRDCRPVPRADESQILAQQSRIEALGLDHRPAEPRRAAAPALPPVFTCETVTAACALFAEDKTPSAVAGRLGLTHEQASAMYQIWLRLGDTNA